MMRQPLRRNASRQQIAQAVTIPAPVKGLNARDPLSAMEPDYALILENLFPDATSCRVRRGHLSHATGMPGAVRTLFGYAALNGTEALFAASGGNIYNVTSAGAVGAAVASGKSGNDWQYVGFTNSAGSFLVAVNGLDTPISYNGTSWSMLTINPQGAGAPSANTFINVTSHKNRLWFIQANSLNAWYLDVDAISGNATKLPLASIFKLGGRLLALGTFSTDAAETLDDYLAFITDQGEVALYQGTNPNSAATWGLVGVYRIAEPIGYRCVRNLNGDLVILTTDGAISMQAALQFDRATQDQRSVTSLIRRRISDDAASTKLNFGWELFTYPNGRWFVVNVPYAQLARQGQYVMNLTTGAWCNFTGLNANCWGLLDGLPYFGGNSGVVYVADRGLSDNGAAYQVDLKTAFSYLGLPGHKKRITAIKPLLRVEAEPPYGIKLNFDFTDSGAPTPSQMAPSSGALIWNQGMWNVHTWGGSRIIQIPTGASGIGNAVAVRFTANISGQSLEVLSFDLVAETGGFL